MISTRLRGQGISKLQRKLIRRLLAIALAAYLFYVPAPWPIREALVPCMQVAGILLIFAGIVGRILASLSICDAGDRVIVTTELYSVCRNPRCFASFLMASGFGLLSNRIDFMILIMMACLTVYCPVMWDEAERLRKKSTDYAEYERRVPMFIPDFRLWQERRQFRIDFHHVRRTARDAFVVVLAVAVIILLNFLSARTALSQYMANPSAKAIPRLAHPAPAPPHPTSLERTMKHSLPSSAPGPESPRCPALPEWRADQHDTTSLESRL